MAHKDIAFCDNCIQETVEVGAGNTCTINGVGTTFYGKSQRCPHCGSVVRQLFWCVMLIPIVPLGKFRVLDCRGGSYFSRRLGTTYRSSDARPLLNLAAHLEGIDRAQAILKYEKIITLFPGTPASVEAKR